MKGKNGVDPNKDCGTVRCTFHCEQCPFNIPEKIDMDPTVIEC